MKYRVKSFLNRDHFYETYFGKFDAYEPKEIIKLDKGWYQSTIGIHNLFHYPYLPNYPGKKPKKPKNKSRYKVQEMDFLLFGKCTPVRSLYVD